MKRRTFIQLPVAAAVVAALPLSLTASPGMTVHTSVVLRTSVVRLGDIVKISGWAVDAQEFVVTEVRDPGGTVGLTSTVPDDSWKLDRRLGTESITIKMSGL